MATIVLTAVGTALGGPIGGAVGAILGQRVDQELFAPKARHGPQLGELAVQTSTYGTAIPKIFGTMRVAGTVIWATDLQERRSTSGGGKGRPKTVSYAYSASFAVALSARPLRAVKRIWADGKLLRGAAGDFKSATGFRLHPGSEDQPPDPLIVAAEGAALAPAYRGLAYAVFEDMQLEDYGNRIPSLSFEVEADPLPVAIGGIAEILSEGAVRDVSTPALLGFAASGDSVRGALEAFASAVALSVVDDGERLLLSAYSEPTGAIADADLTAPLEISRRAEGTVAGEVSLAYYDRDRDYQTGLQRAQRSGPSPKADRQSLAAVVDAGAAKAFAEQRLATIWAARESAKAGLGWSRLDLRPGAVVPLADAAGRWRIARRTIGAGSLGLELTRMPPDGVPAAAAEPGRAIGEPDFPHGPTVIRLHDLPLGAEGKLLLFALAAGASPGWRRAAVLLSVDGGVSWSEAGVTAEAAVLGHAVTALAPAPSTLVDVAGEVEIELLHDGMSVEGRMDAALDGGANLALIGSELLQFGEAEEVGPRRVRLRRLLRGRRGTEWAAGLHMEGDGFALLRPEALMPLEVPIEAVGNEARVLATGVGDVPEGVAATCVVRGETLRPPPPVHLAAGLAANGDLDLRWVRRSRQGWSWPNGADTPLGEEREQYRVAITSGAVTRAFEVNGTTFRYTAVEQAADGTSPPFSVAVCQLGTFGESRPAQTTVG